MRAARAVRYRLPLFALLMLGLLSSGCMADFAARCAPGDVHQHVAQILFGRNIGDRLGVSNEDFERFLDNEVSPRFPDGLTVVDSQGRWLDRGHAVSEPGKLVIIVLPGHADDHAKLGEIAAAYESKFRQDAVLTVIEPACTSLWRAPR